MSEVMAAPNADAARVNAPARSSAEREPEEVRVEVWRLARGEAALASAAARGAVEGTAGGRVANGRGGALAARVAVLA